MMLKKLIFMQIKILTIYFINLMIILKLYAVRNKLSNILQKWKIPSDYKKLKRETDNF